MLARFGCARLIASLFSYRYDASPVSGSAFAANEPRGRVRRGVLYEPPGGTIQNPAVRDGLLPSRPQRFVDKKQPHNATRMVWRNINAVIEGKLFLGTIDAAISPRTLADRRITHIVSVGSEPIPADNPASGIRHLRIRVEDVDYADLLIHLPSACRFIHDAINSGGVVLVHCVQGLSRSATVVAAYLMYSRRVGASEAMEIVRRAREQVWIIPGFQEQLVLFGLCQYNPTPNDGIYFKWRQKIDRYLQSQGQSRR